MPASALKRYSFCNDQRPSTDVNLTETKGVMLPKGEASHWSTVVRGGHFRLVLFNAPLSDRDKKRACNGLIFPGNTHRSSLTPGGPVVPLFYDFRRLDNLLTWQEVFANLHEPYHE